MREVGTGFTCSSESTVSNAPVCFVILWQVHMTRGNLTVVCLAICRSGLVAMDACCVSRGPGPHLCFCVGQV